MVCVNFHSGGALQLKMYFVILLKRDCLIHMLCLTDLQREAYVCMCDILKTARLTVSISSTCLSVSVHLTSLR